MLHLVPHLGSFTLTHMTVTVILDWSGWKCDPLLGLLHTYSFHVTPWHWPHFGEGAWLDKKTPCRCWGPSPERSSTCTVAFGMGEDSYVM